MNDEDIAIAVKVDKPDHGMWHCGPNAAWITVTHVPTGISVTQYGYQQHRARQQAMACLEMLVSDARL